MFEGVACECNKISGLAGISASKSFIPILCAYRMSQAFPKLIGIAVLAPTNGRRSVGPDCLTGADWSTVRAEELQMQVLRYLAGAVVLNMFLSAAVSASNPSRIQLDAQKARAAIKLEIPDRHDFMNLIDCHLRYLHYSEKDLQEYQSPLAMPNILRDPRRALCTVVRSMKDDRFFGNPYCDVISYHEKVLGDVGNDCVFSGAYDSAAHYYKRQIAVQVALVEIASAIATEPKLQSVHTNRECLGCYKAIKVMPLPEQYRFLETDAANTLISLAIANDLAGDSLQADGLYEAALHEIHLEDYHGFALQWSSFENYLKLLLAKIEPDIIRKSPRIATRLELVAEFYSSQKRLSEAIYWYKQAIVIRQQSSEPKNMSMLAFDKRRLLELLKSATMH